jgi:hypothetical protein
MEYMAQLFVELIVLSLASVLMANFLGKFGISRSSKAVVMFPPALFTLGFSLRLSGLQPAVDLGFFMTDFSFLFTYLVFASSFVLGQLKYWKKR